VIDKEISMELTIPVSKHLALELISGTDNSDPALRLFIPDDPTQSFVVFLSEIHLLRDALARAGAQLTEIEAHARKFRS
jgi:hypothetical protein